MKSGNGQSTRTPEQKKALRDAYATLAAQFDQFLIVACTSKEHLNDRIGPDPDVCWAGGWPIADTLANLAKRRIESRHTSKSTPP